MTQSFYEFLYLTVISKDASKAPNLASTHLETNITHFIPPWEPGKESLQKQMLSWQLCDFQRFQVLEQIGEGWGDLKGAVVPKPADWNHCMANQLLSLPFPTSALLFCHSWLFLVSVSFWLFSPASHLCFHVLQSGLQKIAMVFSPL